MKLSRLLWVGIIVISNLYKANKKLYQDLSDADFIGSRDIDYAGLKLCDILNEKNKKIQYEYDFGDSWIHTLVLEESQDNAILLLPICLAGERACPPEDCGGPWGYQDKLDILKDKNHEEYWDVLDWMGEEFDPEEFDLELINLYLTNCLS